MTKIPGTGSRSLTCGRCGASFGCTNDGPRGSCWCSDEAFKLPVPLPAGFGPYADCLCPTCLRAIAEELRAAGHGPQTTEMAQ